MVLVDLIIAESLAAVSLWVSLCNNQHTCLFWISMVCCAFLGYRLSSSLWLAFPHVFLNTLSLQMKSSYFFSIYTYLCSYCDCFMKLFASSVNTHHFIYVTTNSHWKLLPIGKFFRLFALLVKSLIYLHIKYFKNILIQRKWNFLLNTCIFGEFIFVSFLSVFSDHGCPIMTESKEKNCSSSGVLGIHSLWKPVFPHYWVLTWGR